MNWITRTLLTAAAFVAVLAPMERALADDCPSVPTGEINLDEFEVQPDGTLLRETERVALPDRQYEGKNVSFMDFKIKCSQRYARQTFQAPEGGMGTRLVLLEQTAKMEGSVMELRTGKLLGCEIVAKDVPIELEAAVFTGKEVAEKVWGVEAAELLELKCNASAEASALSVEGECETAYGTFSLTGDVGSVEAKCSCQSGGCDAGASLLKVTGAYKSPSHVRCGVRTKVKAKGSFDYVHKKLKEVAFSVEANKIKFKLGPINANLSVEGMSIPAYVACLMKPFRRLPAADQRNAALRRELTDFDPEKVISDGIKRLHYRIGPLVGTEKDQPEGPSDAGWFQP